MLQILSFDLTKPSVRDAQNWVNLKSYYGANLAKSYTWKKRSLLGK